MENEKITIKSKEEKKALLGSKTVIIEEVEVDGKTTERKRTIREMEIDIVSIAAIIAIGVLSIASLVYLFFL